MGHQIYTEDNILFNPSFHLYLESLNLLLLNSLMIQNINYIYIYKFNKIIKDKSKYITIIRGEDYL